RLSYITGCFLTAVCAILTSITGLEYIIKWVTPVLQLIYPPAIALTLCLCFLTPYLGGLRGACYATTLYGLLDALQLWLPMLGIADGIPGLARIPGQADGLGFVWFMVVGWLLGHFVLWKEERYVLDPTKQATVE
ncbi:MAG: branched-chain amino acid transport system II carrier protein, partial [Desulfovibrio sp.]|nr:branched-chain amino acid transport system II carrier protein [Desulfovibrio sp.]